MDEESQYGGPNGESQTPRWVRGGVWGHLMGVRCQEGMWW
jgi:hypothetical protein